VDCGYDGCEEGEGCEGGCYAWAGRGVAWLGSICFRYDDECGERSIDTVYSLRHVRSPVRVSSSDKWGNCVGLVFSGYGFRGGIRRRRMNTGHDRRLGQKMLDNANQTKETDLQPVSPASRCSDRHFNPRNIGIVRCLLTPGVEIRPYRESLDIP
jgi:hypothetical protein